MSKQTPFLYAKPRDSFLNDPKNDITAVHMVKDYLQIDSLATTTGVKSIANKAVSPSDMTIATVDGVRKLLIAAITELTKTGDSVKYFIGTATGGTAVEGEASTLTMTGASWTDYSRKVVHITAGQGQGESAKIISNTVNTLTLDIDAFSIAPDGTSEFEIVDDLSAVYVSATEIVYAAEETTDKAISSADGDPVSVGANSIGLPEKMVEVA